MFSLIFTAGTAIVSAYFFWRFYRAFPKLGRWHFAVAGLLALLAGGRLLSPTVRSIFGEGASDLIRAWAVTWMVVLSWFLVVGITFEAWNVLAWLIGRRSERIKRLGVKPRPAFLAAVAIVLAATAWAYVEASSIGVEHVTVEVDELPDGLDSLTVAQISDVHVGSFRSGRTIDKTVKLLQELRPDIIVSTGDLVDGYLHRIDHHAERLAEATAPLGKYAVLGNHEMYVGVVDSVTFHQQAGFVLLRQDSVSPARGLRLVGVDYRGQRGRGRTSPSEYELVRAAEDGELVVLLKHVPAIDEPSLGSFDLQLSGHTHGGQVFPMGLLTRLEFGFWTGMTDIGSGSRLYVNRGTGTWGTPLRLLARPEITVFHFRERKPGPGQ
jgi:predicted MPP superfamily phosphohydrolase